MTIRSLRAYIKNLSLTKPYRISHETCSEVESVFLEIELENGITGIGAANPSAGVVNDSAAATLLHLQTDFIINLAGRNIGEFRQIISEVKHKFPHSPGRQAAIDIALHDAYGQYLNMPVVALYGQQINSLPTSVTIGIMTPDETIREAEMFYRQGFRILKVKTGLDVEEDIDRVLKLYDRFHDTIKIRVDANQGYSMQELNTFIDSKAMQVVELIEQPLTVGKENELLTINRSLRKQLAADESIKNAADASILSNPPVPFGIFNIKLMKCGGIAGALEIAQVARAASIDLFWGCNDESIVSISAALHAAFACENTRYLDLDGSFDLAEDLVSGGFIIEDGYMSLNGKPGLGVNKLK